GELTDKKGGPEARKAKGVTVPFSPAEHVWIEAAMKLLIRRAAEVAGDPEGAFPQITMEDLPPIS
ncbi:MAG TPA: hypothetical protein VFQ82_02670, partial [Stellaceae bacterium]|nr:hypothetical protein [Stellaceae bacterium]